MGNGQSKILIDTGEFGTSEKYVKYLIGTVFPLTNTTSISIILLTHGHADHIGGVQTILSELKKCGQPIPKIFKRNVLNGKFPCSEFSCENIVNGQCFDASRKRRNSESTGGCSSGCSRSGDDGYGDDGEIFDEKEEIILKALYTPGHTDDHVVFTLQVKGHHILLLRQMLYLMFTNECLNLSSNNAILYHLMSINLCHVI